MIQENFQVQKLYDDSKRIFVTMMMFLRNEETRRQHNVITRKVLNNNNKQLYHLIIFFTYLLIIDCINIVTNRRIKLDFPKKFSDKIQHPLKTFYFLYKIRPMGTHQKIGQPSPAHGFLLKRIQPMGWAGLGWAKPSPLGSLIPVNKSFCRRER